MQDFERWTKMNSPTFHITEEDQVSNSHKAIYFAISLVIICVKLGQATLSASFFYSFYFVTSLLGFGVFQPVFKSRRHPGYVRCVSILNERHQWRHHELSTGKWLDELQKCAGGRDGFQFRGLVGNWVCMIHPD